MLVIEITDRDADTMDVEQAATMEEAMELVESYYSEWRCECWFISTEQGEILASGAY